MCALTIKAQGTDILVSGVRCTQACAVPATHSEAAEVLGKRIREARQARGLSLEDLGALAEVAWTNIGKIERGVASPTVETLIRITTAIELEPGVLLAGITPDMYPGRHHRLTASDFITERARRSSTPPPRH